MDQIESSETVGIVSGILAFTGSTAVTLIYAWTTLSSSPTGQTLLPVLKENVAVFLVSAAFFGLIGGTVIGAVYDRFGSQLPGRTVLRKSFLPIFAVTVVMYIVQGEITGVRVVSHLQTVPLVVLGWVMTIAVIWTVLFSYIHKRIA